MSSNIINKINNRKFTNNTQRIAYRLLKAGGSWVSRKELERNISSATARIRDLRKAKFGGFTVQCASANELNRRGDSKTFFYRIKPTSVKKYQINTVFGQ